MPWFRVMGERAGAVGAGGQSVAEQPPAVAATTRRSRDRSGRTRRDTGGITMADPMGR